MIFNALIKFIPVSAFRVRRGRTVTTTQPAGEISYENTSRHLQVSRMAAWLGGAIPRSAFLQSTTPRGAGLSARCGVFLAAWEHSFEDDLYRWRNDTRLLHLWNGDRKPVSRRKLRKELDELLEKAVAFLVFRKGQSKPSGFVYAMRATSPVQKHFNVGAFLDDENQGVGYGPAAVGLFVRYLFETTDAPKLAFEIYGWNTASIKAVSHMPQFKEEGRRERHVFWNGNLYDLHEFALHRDDFLTLTQTPFWKRMIG